MKGRIEAGQESSISQPLRQLSPEFDPSVREVVLETKLGADKGYHRPVTEEKFLDILGQRVGLVVKDREIIPVIVGLNRPLVLKNHLGRGIRGSVPTAGEQKAIKEISQFNSAHLEINSQATVAQKVLALEAMAGQLPGPFKDFKLASKTKNRLQGDARRAGLIPVNHLLTDLAAMELEPVLGTGENYEDTPVDKVLDKVSGRLAKWFPTHRRIAGLAVPTGSADEPGGGSNRTSFPLKTGDVVFDQQRRTTKNVLIISSTLVGVGIVLAACGPKIINAIDGTPVDVDPTKVYLPTEKPSPTPDISIVAGMETPTAESTVEAPTEEIGQPTVWTPPTVEQLTARGGSVPEEINQYLTDLRLAVEGKVPGATKYNPIWNEGYGNDTRIQVYGSNQQGIIWQINLDGSFNEYPVTVAADPQTVFKFAEGQKFELIEGSENAYVVFTGAGKGEKLAVVRNEVVLADGQTKVCLEYLDFQTKEWKLNSNVLAAMLPEGSRNNLIWQDEKGQWLAGQAGTEQALLNFDLAKKAWVEALPPLPSEFLGQFQGTKYSLEAGNQVVWIPDGETKVSVGSLENGMFVFQVDGQEVKVDPMLAVVPKAKWFLDSNLQIMIVNDESGTYWKYEWDQQTNQWVEKNLPEVSTNFYDPTEIEWNDIASGRWAAAVRQEIEAGKIPTFSDQVVVKPGEPNDYLYEKYGVRFLAYKDDEDLYGTNPETRPIKYTDGSAAFAEIVLGGQSRLVLTEQIANKSGGFTLILMVLGDNEAWERFLSDPFRTKNTAVTPVVEARSAKEMLLGWKGDGSGYAAWFVENGNGLVQTAYDEWLTSGNLPMVMEKVLFASSGFTW